jgi:hypothetical protein
MSEQKSSSSLGAIPSMLPTDLEGREKAYELIQQLMLTRGELGSDEVTE